MKVKPFYELPKTAKTFFWVITCLLNILVVFSACYTSAKSVAGYTLAVTGFVILLLTYSHDKLRRDLLSWPMISYAFYCILVHGYLASQSILDKAVYEEKGQYAYALEIYWNTYTPYIFGGIAALTTALGWLWLRKKEGSVSQLLKISFAANLAVLLISAIIW